jgi:hypothetical protein
VHDHPWDLRSRIISGTLRNQRFLPNAAGDLWNAVTIKTGEGGGPIDEPLPLRLRPEPLEMYVPGDTYSQEAPEIHESIPEPGTVTLVTRTFSRQRDIAMSCYKPGSEWVSAEPRPATPSEVLHFTGLALSRWET